jgi:hypothetical protein
MDSKNNINNEELITILRRENALFLKRVRAIALERDRKLMEIISRIEERNIENARKII